MSMHVVHATGSSATLAPGKASKGPGADRNGGPVFVCIAAVAAVPEHPADHENLRPRRTTRLVLDSRV